MGTITFLGAEYPILDIDGELHVEFWWYHQILHGDRRVERHKVKKTVPWNDVPAVMRLLLDNDGRIVVTGGEEPF